MESISSVVERWSRQPCVVTFLGKHLVLYHATSKRNFLFLFTPVNIKLFRLRKRYFAPNIGFEFRTLSDHQSQIVTIWLSMGEERSLVRSKEVVDELEADSRSSTVESAATATVD